MFSKPSILIFALLYTVAQIAAGASIASLNFKEECVGRTKLLLPEDAEVAAMLPEDFQAELNGGVAQPPFRFWDGQLASSSYLDYGGLLFITHQISKPTQSIFRESALRTRHEVDMVVNQANKNVSAALPNRFENLSTADHVGVAWRVDTNYLAYLEIGSYSILWRVSGTLSDSPEMRHDYQSVVSGMRSRPMFSIPDQRGVCLPNIFIRDEGRTVRNIRTSFRMKSHPDVLILFEDSTADLPNGRNGDPVKSLNDFWGQYEYSSTVREVRSAWHLPSTRREFFGKRPAIASFVRITRTGGTADFGYLAIARGSAGAANDTPDLRMYAIRDAALAQKKGIAPIGEKDFLSIIEKITKSIKGATSD